MALVKAKPSWQKPPTSIYEHNYGYGMNFYQPMIDYISEKKRIERGDPPHLPFSNERALQQYSPRKLVKTYTDSDLNQLAMQSKEQSSRYRMQKTATVTERVRVEAIMKKTKRRKMKQEERQTTYKDQEYDPEIGRQAEWALKAAKRQLRGKSAKAIEEFLLKSGIENVIIDDDLPKIHFSSYETDESHRETVHDSKAHYRMMDERYTKQLDDTIKEPLQKLSGDLKGFGRKTTRCLEEKR